MLKELLPITRFSVVLDFVFRRYYKQYILFHFCPRELPYYSCSSEFSFTPSIENALSLFGLDWSLCWTCCAALFCHLRNFNDRRKQFDICRIVEIVMQISSFALCGISRCTITLISMDRSLALLFGIRYRQIVTLKRVRSTMIIFWILLLSVSLLYLLKEDAFMITFCVFALFCLAISTFSFLKIHFTLRHRQSQVVSQSEREHRQMTTRANVFSFVSLDLLNIDIVLSSICCGSNSKSFVWW